jgi:hypothetical protein
MHQQMTQHGTAAFQPLRPGEILRAALEFYRRRWRTLLAIAAVSAVPLTVALNLHEQCHPGGSCQLLVFSQVLLVTPSSWPAGAAAGVLLVVVGQVVVSLVAGTILSAVATELAGAAPSFGQSFRFGFARFGSLLLVSTLLCLAIVAGFIPLVLPGIYIGVRLAASIPALVVEGRRGSQALSRSWSLVSGQWWHTFGTIVLAWLLLGIVSTVIRGIVHIVTAPVVAGGWVVQALPVAVATMLLLPYAAAVLVLLYLDLRARKEPLGRPMFGGPAFPQAAAMRQIQATGVIPRRRPPLRHQ